MIAKNLTTNKDAQEVIELINIRTKKLKDKLAYPIEATEEEAEKKSTTKQENKYKVILKIASIVAIFALCSLWVLSMSVPSVYEIIAVILEAINPFKSLEGSSDLARFIHNFK